MSTTAQKNINYVGALAFAKGSTANVREYPNTTSKVLKVVNRIVKDKVTSFGQFTGFYGKQTDGIWWHVSVGNIKGWCREDVISAATPISADKKAQSMMDELVAHNLKIRQQLLQMAPVLKSLKDNGKPYQKELQKFKDLSYRLLKREQEIKTNKGLQAQTGIIKKWNDFAKKWGVDWAAVSGIDNIGAVPVALAWIIGVVVVAGLGAAVYAYFSKYHGESKADLVISDALSKALASLDPATAQKVKDDLEGQVDDAYDKGREDEKSENGGMFGSIKNIAMFGGGILLAKWLLEK